MHVQINRFIYLNKQASLKIFGIPSASTLYKMEIAIIFGQIFTSIIVVANNCDEYAFSFFPWLFNAASF